MKTVHINFDVKLIKDEFSPDEKDPELRVFLDARFKRKPVIIGLDAQNVTVSGEISERVTDLPQTAALVLSAFAWRKNDFDAPCLMDTGTNHIFLGAMLNQGIREFDVPLQMHTVDNYEKGVLRIKVNEIKMPNIKINQQIRVGQEMLQYINNTIQMEEKMPDTIPGTSNMRIPYDFSESGLELTNGMPIPAVAYVMSETPDSNPLFWQNAYKTVMRRDNLEESDWRRLSLVSKARIMALMCCYVSQYLDYIGDSVDKNTKRQSYIRSLITACENFGDSMSTDSGDCEDLGTGILQCYNALVSCDLKDNKILQEVQQIARQYIPQLALDAVNGAKVSDENAPKGAHMNDNIVPIYQFRKWMCRTEDGKLLDARLASLYPEKIEENLPFLVGEGTGKLEPLGFNNPNADLMSYVYPLRSLRGFKKNIPRRQGEAGSFLIGSLTGMTDYFIKRGVNIGSMWYTTQLSGRRTGRGAYYKDMMNDHDNVGIKMHEPISKTNMAVIREAIMTRDPPHDLVLSSLDKHDEHERNEHLDYVVKEINSMERPSGDMHRYVPVYVRPHQIDVNLASHMVVDFKNARRIWKVSYVQEKITDRLWGYEVRIYVK